VLQVDAPTIRSRGRNGTETASGASATVPGSTERSSSDPAGRNAINRPQASRPRLFMYRSSHRTILTSDRSRNPAKTIADASAIAGGYEPQLGPRPGAVLALGLMC
jgi:hypothetical protein